MFISFQAAGIYVTVEIGGDVGNAAAALRGEMGGSFVAGFYVVDDDAGAVREFFYPVKKDDGDAFLNKGVEVVEVCCIEGKGSDESVYSFMKKVVDIGGFFAVCF